MKGVMGAFALLSAAVVLGISIDSGHPIAGSFAAGFVLVNAVFVIWISTDIFWTERNRHHRRHGS